MMQAFRALVRVLEGTWYIYVLLLESMMEALRLLSASGLAYIVSLSRE
jgi:hypothetical protein